MSETSSSSAAVTGSAAMVLARFSSHARHHHCIDWTDDEHHPHIAILSSSLAARLFPTGNALGERIRFGFMPGFQDLEVVGIANNARLFDLHDPAAPVVYLPYLQFPEWDRWGYLFVRTKKPPEALAKAVGNEIDSLGREYP